MRVEHPERESDQAAGPHHPARLNERWAVASSGTRAVAALRVVLRVNSA